MNMNQAQAKSIITQYAVDAAHSQSDIARSAADEIRTLREQAKECGVQDLARAITVLGETKAAAIYQAIVGV